MSERSESSVGYETTGDQKMGLHEHLLVAVSHSPNSEYLIRWTERMAERLGASWTVLHVETGILLNERDLTLLRRNLELARRLGAEMISLPADDVAEAVVHYARMKNATQIIIGKTSFSQSGLIPRRRSLTQRIVEKSGSIDVLVVQEKPIRYPGVHPIRYRLRSFSPAPYLISLAVVLLVTGMNLLALPLVGYRSVSIIYLLTITALAFFLGKTAMWVAPALSTLLWNFFFMPPRMTFTIGNLEDILMFVMYFVTAVTIGYLTSRLKAKGRVLAAREEKMTLLYNFSQSLSEKQTIKGIVDTSLAYISRYFHAGTVLFLRHESGSLDRYPITIRKLDIDDSEYDCARYCFEENVPCGRYTAKIPKARFHYVPLNGPGGVMGVLGVRLEGVRVWTRDQEDLLLTLGRSLALSLERELLAQERRRNLMAAESERLSKVLLNTVSHELRTPLTTIKGSITALMDHCTIEDPAARDDLLRETLVAADRLNSIVGNLLSMSRLEAGGLRLRKTRCDVDDMLSVALDQLRGELADRPVEIDRHDDTPEILVDFVLFVQALTNIIQNAAAYTPAGSPVRISVAFHDGVLDLSVCDAGEGVPEPELPHLFEKFYRGSSESTGGVGLGLAICRGIVEEHGGSITANNAPGGGLCIRVRVPSGIPEDDADREASV